MDSPLGRAVQLKTNWIVVLDFLELMSYSTSFIYIVSVSFRIFLFNGFFVLGV